MQESREVILYDIQHRSGRPPVFSMQFCRDVAYPKQCQEGKVFWFLQALRSRSK